MTAIGVDAAQWSKRCCDQPVHGLISSPATIYRFQIRMPAPSFFRSVGNLNRNQTGTVVCTPIASTV